MAAILPAIALAQPRPDPQRTAALIVEEANTLRAAHGLAKLQASSALAAAAREFAEYMAEHEKLDHQADGRTPSERAKRHGYDYCIVAENIGYQFRSRGFRTEELARGLVDGWQRSPRHRENLLGRDVTETGAGLARGPRSGRYYAVQLFGRPASLRREFRVANESSRRVEYRVGSKGFVLPPRTERVHGVCGDEPVRLEGKTVHPAKGERLVVR